MRKLYVNSRESIEEDFAGLGYVSI
jgi:hypothetical protein